VTDQRLGGVFRAVRIRLGRRQIDVARRAGVSASLISLIERGHLGSITVDRLRRVAAALEIRLDLLARWRGGELDRLMNARHATLTEAVAVWITSIPGWVVVPEVSFAFYGERGSVDLVAWHAMSRTLLIIEIKTEIVDLQELLGTLDRKARLGFKIGQERGWRPARVSTWLIVAEGTANRRRVALHSALVRAALPSRGPEMRRWLRDPIGTMAACSFWSNSNPRGTKQLGRGTRRVRRPVTRSAQA
jgi:transcriptional regulator with XRE-family HTH domain